MPDHTTLDGSVRGANSPPFATVLAAATRRAGALLRPPHLPRHSAALLAGFVVLGWLATGIYQVAPDQQAVVLRFGRWVGTELPGLHYHLPYPIGTVLLPKVTSVNQLRVIAGIGRPGGSPMLTGDENIVDADYAVQWKIKDAGAYLFHVEDPEGLVSMAGEAAMREVIGRNPIQAALSDRRQQIAAAAQDQLQHRLDAYGAGILVMQMQLERVEPPALVIDAFNDVQRARADQVRARNDAEAYRNDVLPRARGQADHVLQEAEAYRTQTVDQARGEVKAFLAAYDVYRQAPGVFSWQLYLDSMDEVLRRASRVVVDATGKGASGIVPYLPLGELPVRRAGEPGAPDSRALSAAAPPATVETPGVVIRRPRTTP
jgi:membrane protease subunit HflK